MCGVREPVRATWDTYVRGDYFFIGEFRAAEPLILCGVAGFVRNGWRVSCEEADFVQADWIVRLNYLLGTLTAIQVWFLTMSRSRLPPELLDHIIDFLRDSYLTLKNCCLVSKTWIPRTRKHLFADIEFETTDDVQSWKTVFPDPSTSPARHAKTMFIGCPYVIEAAGKGNGRWLLAFSRVNHLTMGIPKRDPKPMTISLVPFHGFSPALKSLRVDSSALTHSQIFDLVRSLPLLEDLSIDAPDRDGWGSNKQPTVTQPLNSPPFTGSLKLRTHDGMHFIASRLLSLPNGIHFRKLALTWHREEDVSSTKALVDGCCSTLKSLKIDGEFLSTSALYLLWHH